MEQRTGSKLGKEYVKAVYCHPAYLTCMQSIPWEILGWMNHKLESRLPGDISITSDTSEEELKSLLMKVKQESKKIGIKLNIQKMKFMASYHHFMANRGEKVEAVTDFILGGPKSLRTVTAAMKLKDTCSLEEKL